MTEQLNCCYFNFFLASAQGVDLRVREVTYICQINQTISLQWRIGSDPVVTLDFTPTSENDVNTTQSSGNFFATLTGVEIAPDLMSAKLTSTLTVSAFVSGILIDCVGQQADLLPSAEITLLVSGMIH